MSNEFMTYDEALGELLLSQDELNEIVAKGELRAFRDGDDVRFKRDDIIGLKKSRETEPTIVLSDTEADRSPIIADEDPIDLDSISTDETVLNIEGLLEDETEGTTPIPGADSPLEDEIDIGSIGEDTVLDTDGIDLEGDFDLDDDDTLIDAEEDTLLAGGTSRSVQMIRKESHAGWTAGLVLATALLLGPVAILMNLMMGPEGTYPAWVSDSGYLTFLNPLVEGIVGLF